MRRDSSRFAAVVFAALGVWAGIGVARGYGVGPALSVEELAADADVIFKGKAVSSGLVDDAWFKPLSGFVARETGFTVISVLKGDPSGGSLRFRHYDASPQPEGRIFQPQHYRFVIGRDYLVFAKRSENAGSYRQCRANHTARPDQGVLLCSDDQPVVARKVKEAIWSELNRLLKSSTAGDAEYAIGQLDGMSGGGPEFARTRDFDRTNALSAIRPLMAASNSKVALAAITAVGSYNPYMSDERALYWLAAVASAEIPGIGKMGSKVKNVGGELYWKELTALADSGAAGEIRASAVRALGLVREPALENSIGRWLTDRAVAVRASATLLLADFPGRETGTRLTGLANDAAPEVRIGVAHAAGFGQRVELGDVLAKMLNDEEPGVREAAAMSLLSCSPTNVAIAGVFRANLGNEEFKPLFLLALARDNPADYLDGLAAAVEQKTEPRHFWGGQIPAFTAWEILFKYLQALPPPTVSSGKMDRYLDAMEKVGNYSSSEPRDIYAFYLQRGMVERARRYREGARKGVSYDLDYHFKQVDENPASFRRQ